MLKLVQNDAGSFTLFPCSGKMDYEFECSVPNGGLGPFVHSILPDSLHIDPSTVPTSPSPLLTQKTIWAFDYSASYDNHMEQLHSEEEEYVEDFSDEDSVDTIHPAEEIEEIDSVEQEDDFSERNQGNFNQLLYRVYTSSIFVDASLLSRNGGSGRTNWELFRRFLQLVEANKKRACASSRFLANLHTVRFLSWL